MVTNRFACCRVSAGRPGAQLRPPAARRPHARSIWERRAPTTLRLSELPTIAPSWRSLTFPFAMVVDGHRQCLEAQPFSDRQPPPTRWQIVPGGCPRACQTRTEPMRPVRLAPVNVHNNRLAPIPGAHTPPADVFKAYLSRCHSLGVVCARIRCSRSRALRLSVLLRQPSAAGSDLCPLGVGQANEIPGTLAARSKPTM